jgi:hypothetical protein
LTAANNINKQTQNIDDVVFLLLLCEYLLTLQERRQHWAKAASRVPNGSFPCVRTSSIVCAPRPLGNNLTAHVLPNKNSHIEAVKTNYVTEADPGLTKDTTLEQINIETRNKRQSTVKHNQAYTNHHSQQKQTDPDY